MNLSRQTLQDAHQALASIPATNAQQAARIASSLLEIETALAELAASEAAEEASPNSQVQEEAVR